MNDIPIPTNIDIIMTDYYDDMYRLSYHFLYSRNYPVSREDTEDFLHDYYIREKRLRRIDLYEDWGRGATLTGWIWHLFRWHFYAWIHVGKTFHSTKINNTDLHGKPILYDGHNAWSAWASDTTGDMDQHLGIEEFKRDHADLVRFIDYRLADSDAVKFDLGDNRVRQRSTKRWGDNDKPSPGGYFRLRQLIRSDADMYLTVAESSKINYERLFVNA